MKIIFSLLFSLGVIAGLSSCKKRVCEENNTATLIITNQTIEPIQFYFDGVYLYDIMALENETLEVTTGSHMFGAKEGGSSFIDSLDWELSKPFSVCEEYEYVFE